MIKCPDCGHTNEDDDAFCGNCGEFLEWDTGAVAPGPAPAPDVAPAPAVSEPPGQAPPAAPGQAPPDVQPAPPAAAQQVAPAQAAEPQLSDNEAVQLEQQAQRIKEEQDFLTQSIQISRKQIEEARRLAAEAEAEQGLAQQTLSTARLKAQQDPGDAAAERERMDAQRKAALAEEARQKALQEEAERKAAEEEAQRRQKELEEEQEKVLALLARRPRPSGGSSPAAAQQSAPPSGQAPPWTPQARGPAGGGTVAPSAPGGQAGGTLPPGWGQAQPAARQGGGAQTPAPGVGPTRPAGPVSPLAARRPGEGGPRQPGMVTDASGRQVRIDHVRQQKRRQRGPIVVKPGETACRACGMGNDPSRNFCKRCGTQLAVTYAPIKKQKKAWYKRIFVKEPEDPRGKQKDRKRRRRPDRVVRGAVGRAFRLIMVAVAIIAMLGIPLAIARPNIFRPVTSVARDLAQPVLCVVAPQLRPVNAIGATDGSGRAPQPAAPTPTAPPVTTTPLPGTTPPAAPGADPAEAHPPAHAVDLNSATWWSEVIPGPGEGATMFVELDEPHDIGAIGVLIGESEQGEGDFLGHPRPSVLRIQFISDPAKVREAEGAATEETSGTAVVETEPPGDPEVVHEQVIQLEDSQDFQPTQIFQPVPDVTGFVVVVEEVFPGQLPGEEGQRMALTEIEFRENACLS